MPSPSSAPSSPQSGSPGLAPPCGLSDPEQETSSESFVDDLLRGFRTFLMGLPALAPLATKMESAAALPRRAILAALRTLVDEITVAILLEDDYEGAATALVERLAQENDINLEELAQADLAKCAKWLTVIASYYADVEVA